MTGQPANSLDVIRGDSFGVPDVVAVVVDVGLQAFWTMSEKVISATDSNYSNISNLQPWAR